MSRRPAGAGNFLKLRRSLDEHLLFRRMTWNEFAMFVWLCLRANPADGVIRTSWPQLEIETHLSAKHAEQICRALRRKRYVWYPWHRGRRGQHRLIEVAINKYPTADGRYTDLSARFATVAGVAAPASSAPGAPTAPTIRSAGVPRRAATSSAELARIPRAARQSGPNSRRSPHAARQSGRNSRGRNARRIPASRHADPDGARAGSPARHANAGRTRAGSHAPRGNPDRTRAGSDTRRANPDGTGPENTRRIAGFGPRKTKTKNKK